MNGLVDCYTSIYKIRKEEYVYNNGRRKRVYGSVIIDKLFYDLDRFSTCWETTKRLHFRLLEDDIMHTIILSGGGFHIYVMTIPYKGRPEQKMKMVLKNAQHGVISIVNSKIENGNKITIGNPRKSDIDSHVIGDIARIARLPNTWHPKRKRYSIPIHNSDMKLTFKEVLEISKHQRKGIEMWGNNLIDLTKYEKEVVINMDYNLNDAVIKDIEPSSMLSLLPFFIQNLLTSREDGHRARYLTQIGMKIRGFPKSTAEKICKEYWSRKKFLHAISGHGYNSFDYIWSRNDLFFPNWQTLEEEGWKIPRLDYNYKLMYNR